MKKTVSVIFMEIILILLTGCMTDKKIEPIRNGIYYFSNFRKGFELPLEPINEISKEEALNLYAYSIGYFVNDKLVKLENFMLLKDEKDSELKFILFSRFEYVYYNNGKVKEIHSTGRDGETDIIRYDENDKR